jgi:hypothetical protein
MVIYSQRKPPESKEATGATLVEVEGKRFKEPGEETGAIEILCNNPHGNEWKILSMESTMPYHPGFPLEEVKSWIQRELHTILTEEDLE